MEKKKSHIGFNVLVVLLILIILASLGVGLYAWAKYQTSIEGTATGETAKWSFKVDGNTTTEEIDFAITRTDNNTSVAEGKLAPGTYGEINVEIDATGTETMVEYSIVVALTNKPTNLNFYYDEAKTKLISVNKEDKFCVRGFMNLNEVNTVRTEKIYWDWQYETGSTQSAKKINNTIDTKDSGKNMEMNITVKGEQAMEEHIYLSDVVQVGDYVNYNAASGNGANKSYTPTSDLTGTTEGINTFGSSDVFNSDAKSQWRVLYVDNVSGIVELMSVEPSTQSVTFKLNDGFVNAETVLNNIGEIYGYGNGALYGRSINLEDIEQYSKYDPYDFVYEKTYTYGDTKTYTSGDFYQEKKDENGKIISYESTPVTASEDNKVTMTQSYYWYSAQNYYRNSIIYNMIFRNSVNVSNYKSIYWLASRCVSLKENTCLFNINNVYQGTPNANTWNNAGISPAHRVCPVVVLNTKIETTGQDTNGVWQLKL